MDRSSSFDLSIDTIEKSFDEYETSNEEIIANEPYLHEISEIKNPLQKTVNQLAKLSVDARLSLNAVQKIVPVINETTDDSKSVPESKRYFKNNVKKSFEEKIYAKCSKCMEFGEVGTCKKCNTFVKKGRDNFFIYLPIEPQIKKSLIENFDIINEYLSRPHTEALADCDDGEVQKKITEKHQHKKILSLTMNIDSPNLPKLHSTKNTFFT